MFLKPNFAKKLYDLQALNCVSSVYKSVARLLHIDAQETPNPDSIKLTTGKEILKDDSQPTTFSTPESAESCAIAKQLHEIPGIQNVFISRDFITVSKSRDYAWVELVEEVKEVMSDYFSSNPYVHIPSTASKDPEGTTSHASTKANRDEEEEEEDEIVMTIKQLLEEKIRPTIQADGGDVIFMGFEGGVVKVKLQGSCTSCPSSEVTLKRGVQNMLQFYVPEVMGVIQVTDEKDELSSSEFDSFENSLKKP